MRFTADAVEDELDGHLVGLDAPGAAFQQAPRAGGEQGGLARTRHAGHQGEAAAHIPGGSYLLLNAQLPETRRRARQHAERDVDGKAARGLHRGQVAAKTLEDTAPARHGMGAIDGAPGPEDAFAGRVVEPFAQAPQHNAVERRAGRPAKYAVDFNERRRAGLKGDIRGAAFSRPQQERIEPGGRKTMRRLRPPLAPVLGGHGRAHLRSPLDGARQVPALSVKRAGRVSSTDVAAIRISRSCPATLA